MKKNDDLTDAEVLVFQKVVVGMSNIEAAKSLSLSEKTVKFHLTSVYKKMGVKSRSQLIVNHLS